MSTSTFAYPTKSDANTASRGFVGGPLREAALAGAAEISSPLHLPVVAVDVDLVAAPRASSTVSSIGKPYVAASRNAPRP